MMNLYSYLVSEHISLVGGSTSIAVGVHILCLIIIFAYFMNLIINTRNGYLISAPFMVVGFIPLLTIYIAAMCVVCFLVSKLIYTLKYLEPSHLYKNLRYIYREIFPVKFTTNIKNKATGNIEVHTYRNNDLHSYGDDPAVIIQKDDCEPIMKWYYKGMLHREGDNPAEIYDRGQIKHYRYGKLHRLNGPAVYYSPSEDHGQEFYLNGKHYESESEFLLAIRLKDY